MSRGVPRTGGLGALFESLWNGYLAITPVAMRIHKLLSERGETIVNDHVALRTFHHPSVEIEVLDREFCHGGYEPAADYHFKEKKLIAYHYEHPEPGWPKLFISALLIDELPEDCRAIIENLLAQITPGAPAKPGFASSGRHWQIDYPTYQTLRTHSEYAAWLAAFGFRANHFTIAAHQLSTFTDLGQLNRFLRDHKIQLNDAGGEIKGSPDDLLEQSSTMAEEIQVPMSDGDHAIPSCYYEFARRHAAPDGQLFQGFVPASADRLFESTDPR